MRVPRTLSRTTLLGAILTTALAIALSPGSAAQADPTSAEVTTQIEQAANELEDVIEAYNGIGEKLQETRAAAADVTNRINDLTTRLDTAHQEVRTLVSAAYRGSGGISTVSVLLSAPSTDSIVDQVATLNYVNRSQQREIDTYLSLKQELEAQRERHTRLIDEQSHQQRQLAERKSKIENDIRDLEALKRRLNAPRPVAPSSGGAEASSGDTTTPPPAGSGSAGAAVAFARAQLGKPYVYGASGPGSYDCSGLTQASWRAAGVALPHNAAQQWNRVAHVARAGLQPGDLVFYRGLGHVAIYIGSGKVIHAPMTGDVVRIASVDLMSPYGYGRPG